MPSPATTPCATAAPAAPAFSIPAARVLNLFAEALRRPGEVPACATRATKTAVTRALDGAIVAVAVATKRDARQSSFLRGGWAPQRAARTEADARVTGALPRALRGMFVTVGPNPAHLPRGGYHLFDGDGAVVAVRVRGDGRASFAFRTLGTAKHAAERQLGHSRVISIGALSGPSGLLLILLRALQVAFEPEPYAVSTANTNIEQHGGTVFALWERGMPYRLRLTPDGAALECDALMDFAGQYCGPFSAHPVVHARSGRLFAVSYTLVARHDVVVVVLDQAMRVVRKIPLHLGRKPMIHGAAITDRFVIILDFPLLFNPMALFQRGGNAFNFHERERSRIGLMPVDAESERDVRWFDLAANWSFHTACAWDTEGGVVFYACQTMSGFNLQDPLQFAVIKLVKYTLDLESGTTQLEEEPVDLSAHVRGRYSFDFPMVNKAASGGPTEFVYMAVLLEDDEGKFLHRGIVKYNTFSRKVAGFIRYQIDGRPATAVGEASFVANDRQESEDDGHILVFVRDKMKNVCMQVYDAKSMSEDSVASVFSPSGFHIPNGFHSEFVDERVLQSM